jgi:hypothetical protein
MFSNFFFLICGIYDNAEKYGRARQAPDDNIIGQMHIACWKPKVTNTCSECVIHSASTKFYD